MENREEEQHREQIIIRTNIKKTKREAETETKMKQRNTTRKEVKHRKKHYIDTGKTEYKKNTNKTRTNDNKHITNTYTNKHTANI